MGGRCEPAAARGGVGRAADSGVVASPPGRPLASGVIAIGERQYSGTPGPDV